MCSISCEMKIAVKFETPNISSDLFQPLLDESTPWSRIAKPCTGTQVSDGPLGNCGIAVQDWQGDTTYIETA